MKVYSDSPVKSAKVIVKRLYFDWSDWNGPISGCIPELTTITDKNGAYELTNLPENTFLSLEFVGNGYAKNSSNDKIPVGTENTEYILSPESRIEGTVLFGETGKPAENISVQASGPRTFSPISNIAKTDNNGFYSIPNLQPGLYIISTVEDDKNPEYKSRIIENIFVDEGKTTGDINIQLVKCGVIKGRVFDEETDVPISGHLVTTQYQENNIRIYLGNSFTDKNGYYRIWSVPGKALVKRESLPGYIETGNLELSANVIEGELLSNIDFTFKKGVTITGKVFSPEGSPVGGVFISNRDSEWTDMVISKHDGTISITGLKEGNILSVNAEHKEKKLRGNAECEVSPGNELIIKMERYETTSVEGRVIDEQGIPMTGVMVLLHNKVYSGAWMGTSSVRTITDGSGKYRITDLIIGDKYSIGVKAKGYSDTVKPLPKLKAEMSPLADVVMIKADKWIEGTIIDSEGVPVSGAEIWSIDSPTGSKKSITDSKGHYRIDYLTSMFQERLFIEQGNYGRYRFNNVKTNEKQDFTLVKGNYFLEGRVVDTENNPVVGYDVNIDPKNHDSGIDYKGCKTDNQGRFRLESILDEIVTISVSRLEYIHRGTVTIGFLDTIKKFENVETNRDGVTFILK